MSPFFLYRPLIRLMVRVMWGVLMLLALAGCDGPHPSLSLCGQFGGRWITRPLPDGSGGLVNYCIFPDGTECTSLQFTNGTCELPTSSVPSSPLATPNNRNTQLGADFRLGALPQSLDELVSQAPLIFIGEVGSVAQYLEFYGYRDDGQLRGYEIDAAGNPLPGFPVTDFQLQVEEMIRDDGVFASGEPIILRVSGHITEELKQRGQASEFPLSYTGDRHLFLLSPNPDGTYGFHFGPWSRLIVDGDILRVSNGAQQPLQFGENLEPITLDEFILYVQTRTPSEASAPISPLATPSAAGEAMGGGFAMVYPTSLEDLIGHSDLIFIGTVGPVVQYLEYCGYDDDGQLREKCIATDVAGNPAPGFPLTDFQLHVEEVLCDDGTIARGEPVILRELGHITAELKQLSQGGEFPASYTGDRYLFLLSPTPDGKAYGFYTVWGRLIIDGEILRVSTGDQQPLQFGDSDEPITLDEFIKAVKGE